MQTLSNWFRNTLKSMFVVWTCSANFSATGQTEYFVSLNPVNGNLDLIRPIPNVNWVQPGYFAYCEQTSHYTFCGSQDTRNWFLYTLDANSGKVVYSPAFRYASSDSNERIHNLVYSNCDGQLYGVLENRSKHTSSFVSINAESGEYRMINKVDSVVYYSLECGMFDSDCSQFIFLNADSQMNFHVHTIEARSGKMLSRVSLPSPVTQVAYDQAKKQIIALRTTPDFVQMLSIDPFSGLTRDISNRLPLKGYYGLGGFYAYNQQSRSYSFAGPDSLGNPLLLTVTDDGIVASGCPFPYVSMQGSNVLGFQYDSQLDKLFAIHWEPATAGYSVRGFIIFPNPFVEEATIQLKKSFDMVEVFIYSSEGRLVDKRVYSDTGSVTLRRNQLASGLYFIEVYGDGIQLGISKLIAR